MRVVACSVLGTHHERMNIPCQDAYALAECPNGTGMVAVADGAGSAQRAAEGASIATLAAVSYAAGLLATAPVSAKYLYKRLPRIMTHARSQLSFLAAHEHVPVEEYATTLLLAIVTNRYVGIAHIGDGAIVAVTANDELTALNTPPRRTYINETPLLIEKGYRRNMHATILPRARYRGIALLTDGVEGVSIELRTYRPHPGFFLPVFANQNEDSLRATLTSAAVCERTGDDKTIAVITL